MTSQPQVNHDDEVTFNTGRDWLYFLLSVAFQAALILFIPEFAWVGLPFWTTFLVKALRQM